MSRRSANGMLRRKLFNIQSNPDSAAAPYPNTAPRSSKHDFTAAPYPSTAVRNSRQSVTTALIDSRAATLPERGGFVARIDVIEIEPFGPRASRNLSAPSALFRVTSLRLLRTTSGEKPKCEYSMTRIH